MSKTETVRVTWEVDVEVPVGTTDREIAKQVAGEYFQSRIAEGQPDTACVFHVAGTKVDLSDRTNPTTELAEAALKFLKEVDDKRGVYPGTPDVNSLSSAAVLKRLIDQAWETL